MPPSLEDGVYACFAVFAEQQRKATMHKGSRPTFHDTPSCEVHVLDEHVPFPPEYIDIEIVELLRGIFRFPSAEALSEQMLDDNQRARDILGT